MDEEALQFLGAIKPVLSLPDADLAGYRTLQEMEGKYTEIALREMALASAIVSSAGAASTG